MRSVPRYPVVSGGSRTITCDCVRYAALLRDRTAGYARSADDGSFGAYGRYDVTTTGWNPGCDHDAEPVPCVVIDPFAGSGTTLMVARDHGRHSIGIELNEEYLRIAANRLAQQSLLTGDAA